MFRVRATLRRRWLSVLVVTGIVAVVTGTVMTLAAGARRTAKAPDAFTDAVGGELDATVEQNSGPPRTAEVLALPGVESVETITFIFANVTGPAGGPGEGAIALAGSRLSTSRLVAGRPADPADPHEFVASQGFVDEQGAQLGDRFPLVSWTREQLDRGGFFVEPPEGYSFDAELVGIIDAPEGLENRYTAAFVSPGIFDAEPVVSGMTIMSVRLEPGATTEELRAELDRLPNGTSLTVAPGRIVAASIRGAVDAEARGIWLMAAVAAIGAVVALGQILSRQVRVADVERRPLQAVGSTSGQLAGESLTRAAVPAIAGPPSARSWPSPPRPTSRPASSAGSSPAWESTSTPASCCSAAWRWWSPCSPGSACRSSSDPTMLRRGHRSRASRWRGARPALQPQPVSVSRSTGHERSATTAAGTLVTLGLLVGGIVAAATFAASLDRLVTDPGRFGSNYTFAVEGNEELTGSDMRQLLEPDPDIAGLMILTGAEARSGGMTLDLIGVEHVKGDLAPARLVGRLPAGPDEVALGRVTAGELDLEVGDELELTGPGGAAVYRVVGLAVVPGFAGYGGVGQGGVMTAEGLLRLEPAPDASLAAITLRSGAPADTGERLGAVGRADAGAAGPSLGDRERGASSAYPGDARGPPRHPGTADLGPRAPRLDPEPEPGPRGPARAGCEPTLDRARRALAGDRAHGHAPPARCAAGIDRRGGGVPGLRQLDRRGAGTGHTASRRGSHRGRPHRDRQPGRRPAGQASPPPRHRRDAPGRLRHRERRVARRARPVSPAGVRPTAGRATGDSRTRPVLHVLCGLATT